VNQYVEQQHVFLTEKWHHSYWKNDIIHVGKMTSFILEQWHHSYWKNFAAFYNWYQRKFQWVYGVLYFKLNFEKKIRPTVFKERATRETKIPVTLPIHNQKTNIILFKNAIETQNKCTLYHLHFVNVSTRGFP
jgi:hypothetical protein